MSLPLPADNPVASMIKDLLDRSFPSIDLTKDLDDTMSPPIDFYDRHISSHLALKRVQIIPSLHENLAESIMGPLEEFANKGYLPKYAESAFISRDMPREPLGYATSVGQAYDNIFGSEVAHIVTKMLFTPEAPEWVDVMSFIPGYHEPLPGVRFFNEGRLIVNSDGDMVRTQPPHLALRLPESARDLANDLGRVYQRLAMWSFFSHTRRGRNTVSLMPSMSSFKWESTHTMGAPTMSPASDRPPDAHRGFAKEEIDLFLSRRRKGREIVDPRARPNRLKNRDVRIGRPRAKRNYLPIPKDYIQKAWSSAVYDDVTYMMFNCGSHERIGIRHRASQTLYLSGLIDARSVSPAYGRIQLGLFLAILQDAIDRRKPREEFNVKFNASLKRRAAMELDVDDTAPPFKRPRKGDKKVRVKLANLSEEYTVSLIEEKMAERPALLISLHYDDFNSPSPSCFLRTGPSCVRGLSDQHFKAPARRTLYKSSQYITAKLRSPIGRGAIGVAHRAAVQVLSDDSGETLERDCLVKLAFSTESRAALENEFRVYQYLAKKDVVSGILRVHGLFEDTETETLAMVMDYGGYSLRRRELDYNKDFLKDYIYISEDDWPIYLKAIQQLHEAGLCHNDVRIDNFVVNHANEIAVIDFDRATFTDDVSNHNREIEQLEDTLEYPDPKYAEDSSNE